MYFWKTIAYKIQMFRRKYAKSCITNSIWCLKCVVYVKYNYIYGLESEQSTIRELIFYPMPQTHKYTG
mgnify:CR=1 FL=1